MKTWVTDIDAYEENIIGWFLGKENLYHQVLTTCAPTQIDPGSPAGNVMPQNMSAVINFRLSPPDTPETLLAHCEKVTKGEVELSYVQQIEASRPSDTDAWGYRSLKAVLEHYFDRLLRQVFPEPPPPARLPDSARRPGPRIPPLSSLRRAASL